VDERKLAELFRDAAQDAPPASFNEHDVLAASHRARARARATMLTGSTLAVVILAGGATVGVSLWGGTEQAANAPAAAGAPEAAKPHGDAATPFDAEQRGAPPPRDRNVQPQLDVPKESSEQGGAPSGKTGPSANGCGQADGKLANALAGELPSTVRVGGPRGAGFTCRPGMRAAAYEVKDGAFQGKLTVVVVPKQQAPEASAVGWPPGSVTHQGTGVSGDTFVLVSERAPDSPEAPFSRDLNRIGDGVAKHI
jgi:hypothetical protein